MKILTTDLIREADAYTIANEPIKSIDLMERAATRLFEWIMANFPKHRFAIFVGPGNNGGDGLALARLLANNNCNVRVFEVNFTDKRSENFKTNYNRLKKAGVKIETISTEEDFPELQDSEIVVDAIFGSGLSRPAKGLVAGIIQKINSGINPIVSIDIPSGLFAEDNSNNCESNIILADHTLTFQFPKLSFLFAENEIFVGEWHVLDIGLHPGFIEDVDTPYQLIELEDIKSYIIPRTPFAHKGDFGHALLIAGSYGKMGACVLAARAALRSGLGLLTAHVPSKGYEIIQTAVPEAMVSIDKNAKMFSNLPKLNKYNAVGIGPGLGVHKASHDAFLKLLKNNSPLVIDADGLNSIAKNPEWIKLIPQDSILTPHPKEFDRLVGESSNSYERLQKQIKLAKQIKSVVIVKGHFTAIAFPDGKVYFNTTGNPGMATGGSGDVLTGIILSLFAQGFLPDEAALAGVFIHGLAADMAVETVSQTALMASDIIDFLPEAFKMLEDDE